MRKRFLFWGLVLLAILCAVPAAAQSDFTIGMRRDFGYSSGTGDIEGTFSVTASGPDDLVKVVFLMDGEPMGEDTESPFKLQFNTGTYANGLHTISARGTTAGGAELVSNEIRANFVPAGEGVKAAGTIIAGVLGLVVGAMVLSFVLTMASTRKKGRLPLGAPRSYGLKGGTICTSCGRPFSLHMTSFNLVVGVFDFCPHCGKWQLARRVPIEMLRNAEKAELEWEQPDAPAVETDEAEKLRKQLDASRYQE
ncbi:MAG: Ig-like domain-containing protein [Chloroflexota bacterium]